MKLNTDSWTYGVEHELSDWDSRKKLPKGYKRSDDYTIVNSNGIAAQPNNRIYTKGGEINTPPTKTIEEQCKCLDTILNQYPNCTVNYRSNLHCHIRVPGLVEDLYKLKQIQQYIHTELAENLIKIEPIPKASTLAEKKRQERMYVSHHTLLPVERVMKQLEANSIKEFFENEVPHAPNGRVLWHLQPRVCVNLRQLLDTDTIEFRHFPGTISLKDLKIALEWCRDFLIAALEDNPIAPLVEEYKGNLHTFKPFDEELEIGYQATFLHGSFSEYEVRRNIGLILRGGFNGTEAHGKATAIARGLPWEHMQKPSCNGNIKEGVRS